MVLVLAVDSQIPLCRGAIPSVTDGNGGVNGIEKWVGREWDIYV